MDWNVKEDFCANGEVFTAFEPMRCTFRPAIRIETDRRLTDAEKRRVVDALVKAASVEMIHIAKEKKK